MAQKIIDLDGGEFVFAQGDTTGMLILSHI